MSSGDILPPTPVTLADGEALNSWQESDGGARRTIQDSSRLVQLDSTADALGFVDSRFWVETTRALSIPLDFKTDEEVEIVDFPSLSFEGTFLCYSKITIGKILGRMGISSVDALCLTFHEATLLPYFEGLRPRHLLYTPVLAVNEIARTEAAA